MPLTKQQLIETDAKRNFGEELLQAIVDVKAARYGAVHTVKATEAVEAQSKARYFRLHLAGRPADKAR